MKARHCLRVGLVLASVGLIAVTAYRQPTIRDAFKGQFLVGAALNEAQLSGRAPAEASLVVRQFNSITPENVMKWSSLHPQPGRYNFGPADQFVEFGEQHGMFIVGHTLIWHEQTPQWVFEEDGKPAPRETLLQRMREHITTVVGRYKGRVKGWDVVNEALEGDGSLRRSPWLELIGEDYLAKAYQFAHEADPEAELYYNDYGLENEVKRMGALDLIKKLQAAGAKIDGVGIQEHVSLTWPTTKQLDETLVDFAQLGVKTMITELDVDVLPAALLWNGDAEVSKRRAADPALNPYTNGLPDHVQQELADRYAQLFAVYLKHSNSLQRVTFWGVTDGQSWLNNWPIHGRIAHPLLFDRNCQPKPAFKAVLDCRPQR